mgnify:CR=1 FL=1
MKRVGYTPTCNTCKELEAGIRGAPLGHTPACRKRVEEEMKRHENLNRELEKAETENNEVYARQMEEMLERKRKVEEQQTLENDGNERKRGKSIVEGDNEGLLDLQVVE